MAEKDTEATPSRTPCSAEDAERMVRGMGLIFSNTFLYGPNHGVTRKSVEDCYAILVDVMQKCEEVMFTSSEEGLLVDGMVVEQKNPLMRMFVTQLSGLEISSFSLTRGMSMEKFEELIGIMNTKPEELKKSGGFVSVVASSGIENVRVKKVTFRQVEENEVVITQGEVDKGKAAEAQVQNVAEIVAFLGGEEAPQGVKDSAAKSLQGVSSDSQKLADLIIEAAKVHKESAAMEDAKSFSKLVIESLKRAYEVLIQDPSVKTQKGRKNLSRTLLMLQEQMLKKINEVGGGVSDSDAGAIGETIEEMNEELKIDSLTDEFIKKKSAAKASEDRILKYLKKRGVDNIDQADLKDKLSDAGLTQDEWEQLVLRSGAGGGEGKGEEDDLIGVGAAVGHLAALLVKMEERFVKNKPAEGLANNPEFDKTLHEMGDQVNNVASHAEKKIGKLVQRVKADRAAGIEEKDKDGKPPAISRAKLLETLAEAVQELCQPLAVINCSLDMMRTNVLGEINPQQKEMLDLASTSGERVVTLVNKLMEISGVPRTMTPDAAIQKSLY